MDRFTEFLLGWNSFFLVGLWKRFTWTLLRGCDREIEISKSTEWAFFSPSAWCSSSCFSLKSNTAHTNTRNIVDPNISIVASERHFHRRKSQRRSRDSSRPSKTKIQPSHWAAKTTRITRNIQADGGCRPVGHDPAEGVDGVTTPTGIGLIFPF